MMKSHCTLSRWPVSLLLAGVIASHADDRQKPPAPSLAQATEKVVAEPAPPITPVTETELRATVSKSLDYLAKGGDQWMNERSCNSCHHMPQLLWNHREARARGFAIDEKKFVEWLKWTEANAKNIGPGREMTAFLKLALPDKPMPDLTKIVAAGQLQDGSWKAAGQFLGQKRPAPEVTANSSLIFLLALAANDEDRAISDDAMKKAGAMFAKNEKANSVETLSYRVIVARRFGNQKNVVTISSDIAKLQHPDGGWGWQITDGVSDSIATGLALYALQPSSDSVIAAAITRAQRFLIATQKDDGGWPVDYAKLSKTDRSKPEKAKSRTDANMIYSYWGTAWSTLSLLQGVPLKKAVAGQR